jgi:hypothetical protein
MNMLWGIATASVSAAVIVQTARLHQTVGELADVRSRAVRAEQERAILRHDVLRQVSRRVHGLPPSAITDTATRGDALYVIVDSKCGACREALVTLRDSGSALPLRVGSRDDSPDELRAWLAELGVPAALAAGPLDRAIVDELPANATPVFLEMRDGEPVSFVIGQPRAAWLGSRESAAPDRPRSP